MFRVRELLPFVLLFSFFSCCPGYSYSGGRGIKNDPYQISSAADWQILTGDPNNWDKHFVLTMDINLSETALRPVGDSTTGFTGHFNGNNYRIYNASINTPTQDYVGLFGQVVWNGLIQDLGLINAHMTGNSYVGGLAGGVGGGCTILHCYTTGTVSGIHNVGGLAGINGSSRIISSYADCTVDGYSSVGGLVGWIGSDFGSWVVHCYAEGPVSGFTNVGGLIGMTWYGYILDCFATGSVTGTMDSDVIGGLIGQVSYSTITACYATGTVSGSVNSTAVGGLAGLNYDALGNCFWNTQTCGQPNGIGSGSEVGVYGRTTIQMKQQSTFTDYGWDFVGEEVNGTADIWRMCADGAEYPKHNRGVGQKGDLTCPDGVAMEDLAYLARHWLEYTTYPLDGADITGDATVNLLDFEVLADSW